MSEKILGAIEKFDRAFDTFAKSANERFDALQNRVESIESLADRPTGLRREHTAQMKALDEFARSGRGLEAETKEMSIAGGASAGEALVPEFINDTIINKALGTGKISSIVRSTKASTGDYVRLLNLRGQSASWSSETGTRSATNSLELREIRPTHGELYANVTVTNWLLQDSKFDVASMIMENAAAQFARSLETSIISGDGSNKPTGLLANTPTTSADDASPQRAQDVLRYIAGTDDLSADIVGLYFDLKPEYRPNATFVMSSPSLGTVRKLRDTSGSGFLFQERLAGAIDAPDGTILGKACITCEDLSTIGNSPQVFGLLVGDFMQGYEIVQYGGMTIVRDPYSVKGKTSFYIAARFGGRIVDNDAIRVLAA